MNETVARQYVKMGVEFLMLLTSLPQSEMKVLVHLIAASGFSGEARLTQAEMGAAVGVSLRAVSKAYARLRKAGIIAIAGHGRVVINPQVVMRGTEAHFHAKAARYRSAMTGKPIPEDTVVSDNKAFLEAVLGPLDAPEEQQIEAAE